MMRSCFAAAFAVFLVTAWSLEFPTEPLGCVAEKCFHLVNKPLSWEMAELYCSVKFSSLAILHRLKGKRLQVNGRHWVGARMLFMNQELLEPNQSMEYCKSIKFSVDEASGNANYEGEDDNTDCTKSKYLVCMHSSNKSNYKTMKQTYTYSKTMGVCHQESSEMKTANSSDLLQIKWFLPADLSFPVSSFWVESCNSKWIDGQSIDPHYWQLGTCDFHQNICFSIEKEWKLQHADCKAVNSFICMSEQLPSGQTTTSTSTSTNTNTASSKPTVGSAGTGCGPTSSKFWTAPVAILAGLLAFFVLACIIITIAFCSKSYERAMTRRSTIIGDRRSHTPRTLIVSSPASSPITENARNIDVDARSTNQNLSTNAVRRTHSMNEATGRSPSVTHSMTMSGDVYALVDRTSTKPNNDDFYFHTMR